MLVADLDTDMLDDSVYYLPNGAVEKTEKLDFPAEQFSAFRLLYKLSFRIISS